MSNTPAPVYADELMLAGWRETHNGGATVTFWLPESALLDVFRGMTVRKGNTAGQRFAAVLVEIDNDGTPLPVQDAAGIAGAGANAAQKPDESRTPVNQLARHLHIVGYFRNPKLWAAMEAAGIYTQDEHKHYIESLACILASDRELAHGPCGGDVCLHHCASAALPARGGKVNPRKVPHWYGIPVCHNHHSMWIHGTGFACATRADKEKHLTHAVELTANRIKEAMKVSLVIESLSEIDVPQLNDFERTLGLPLTIFEAEQRAA